MVHLDSILFENLRKNPLVRTGSALSPDNPKRRNINNRFSQVGERNNIMWKFLQFSIHEGKWKSIVFPGKRIGDKKLRMNRWVRIFFLARFRRRHSNRGSIITFEFQGLTWPASVSGLLPSLFDSTACHMVRISYVLGFRSDTSLFSVNRTSCDFTLHDFA